jgi:hypothetical protein
VISLLFLGEEVPAGFNRMLFSTSELSLVEPPETQFSTTFIRGTASSGNTAPVSSRSAISAHQSDFLFN